MASVKTLPEGDLNAYNGTRTDHRSVRFIYFYVSHMYVCGVWPVVCVCVCVVYITLQKTAISVCKSSARCKLCHKYPGKWFNSCLYSLSLALCLVEYIQVHTIQNKSIPNEFGSAPALAMISSLLNKRVHAHKPLQLLPIFICLPVRLPATYSLCCYL